MISTADAIDADVLRIRHEFQAKSALVLSVVYWFDKYSVNDFALSPVTSLAQPATGTPTLMMLGYFYALTPRTR
jgi:hypothetical protein